MNDVSDRTYALAMLWVFLSTPIGIAAIWLLWGHEAAPLGIFVGIGPIMVLAFIEMIRILVHIARFGP